MSPHEEFLEVCTAATAGELTVEEQAKLDAHLTVCSECRRAMSEYEIASQHGAAALAAKLAPEDREVDNSWSVERAESAFLKRLETEKEPRKPAENHFFKHGQRFTYRPSQVRWHAVSMPMSGISLIALALCITA